MLQYEDLRKLVQIDLTALDDECAKQPELFMEACDLAAEAKANAKAAKHNLEAVKGEVGIKYRSGELKTDVKITETSIVSLVDAHEEVKQAKEELRLAEKEAYRCESLVNSFDQKRSMLNNEVDLQERQHYQTADIKGRRQNREATEEAIRKVRSSRSG